MIRCAIFFASVVLGCVEIGDGQPSSPADPNAYMPTKCESCQIFANEFQESFARKPKSQSKAEEEAWLIEELESICNRMLDYRLHKERHGIERFSKDTPRMAKFAKEMASRGVDIKLDLPIDALDKPTVETGMMRQHCEILLGNFEEDIEEWVFARNSLPFKEYLCDEKFAQYDSTCRTKPQRKNEL